MPEVLTETTMEALSGKELDAAIGRLMGLEVLGEVICELSPTCGSLQVPDRLFSKSTDRHIPRPVHLRQCSCAHREPSDVEFFGHIWLCLDVVPKYSQSIEAARQVAEKMRAAGVWTHIQTFTHTTQVFVAMGVPSSECQEWGATMAEAICKCALKAEAKFQAIANKAALIDFESQIKK